MGAPFYAALPDPDSLPPQETGADVIVFAKLGCEARAHSNFHRRLSRRKSAKCRSTRARTVDPSAAATHTICDVPPARIFRDTARGTPVSPAFPPAVRATLRSAQ